MNEFAWYESLTSLRLAKLFSYKRDMFYTVMGSLYRCKSEIETSFEWKIIMTFTLFLLP